MMWFKQPRLFSAEFGLSKKIISDIGMNFTSEMFRQFCMQMNIEQAIKLCYHHQNSGHIEACLKYVKHTIKNALIPITM